MNKLIIQMSKDRKKWITFSKLYIPKNTFFIPDEYIKTLQFHYYQEGYKFWRIRN